MKRLTLTLSPKYQQFNAPICLLDEKWKKRNHINGDLFCNYLSEVDKLNAKAVFDVKGKVYFYELMLLHSPAISQRHHTIKTALDKAKNTISPMARKIGAQ